jgi:hypothetical protein
VKLQRDGSWGKSPADYAREAVERNTQQPTERQKAQEVNSWRSITEELLRFGSHGQQAELKRLAETLQSQGPNGDKSTRL